MKMETDSSRSRSSSDISDGTIHNCPYPFFQAQKLAKQSSSKCRQQTAEDAEMLTRSFLVCKINLFHSAACDELRGQVCAGNWSFEQLPTIQRFGMFF